MIFYIADTHFGHQNIIRFCNRPFPDADTMDREMIARWQGKVRHDDTVYIVGDMFFRSREITSVLDQLPGKKHLILGNHDSCWTKKVDLSCYFLSVQDYLEANTGKELVTLCHYPLLSWKQFRKRYMIHGHIHNDTSMDYWPCIAVRDNLLNAGVDLNDFQPVTLQELQENNRRFKHGAIEEDYLLLLEASERLADNTSPAIPMEDVIKELDISDEELENAEDVEIE